MQRFLLIMRIGEEDKYVDSTTLVVMHRAFRNVNDREIRLVDDL
jgi:hypothetical protein